MKKQQIFVLGFSLLAVAGLVASLGVVSAYRGDPSMQGPNCDEGAHELLEEAFDSLDYEAWASLMEGKGRGARVLELVGEEDFVLFVEAHEAVEDGDFALAEQLRAQLGLNDGRGPRDGTGYGGRGVGRGVHGVQGCRNAE
ncbi:hypothetical protein JXA12_03285 [Candidatus Woesearchaeota archaeon]|nr:hypothetical protein [Candidatus Woesearchaeota archaeon]